MEIGSASLPCTRTSYRVKVGNRQATMRTIASAAFAWGDVGSEIKTSDGTVLYRAQVVDAGTAGQHGSASVATTDE